MQLDEALDRVLQAVVPLPIEAAERVSTFDARGRILAADLRSLIDVPPADNTAMDGYALRAADVSESGVTLPLSQRIAAGAIAAPLLAGTAARIFTGGQLPAGADAAFDDADRALLTDPQNNGGLLVACAEADVAAVVDIFRAAGCARAARVGRVLHERADEHGGARKLRVVAPLTR
jgi:hypothetical protein